MEPVYKKTSSTRSAIGPKSSRGDKNWFAICRESRVSREDPPSTVRPTTSSWLIRAFWAWRAHAASRIWDTKASKIFSSSTNATAYASFWLSTTLSCLQCDTSNPQCPLATPNLPLLPPWISVKSAWRSSGTVPKRPVPSAKRNFIRSAYSLGSRSRTLVPIAGRHLSLFIITISVKMAKN